MNAVADHLWQSTWCGLAMWLWVAAWRGGFARVRHAFLMLAAVKFLVPFSLLYAFGARHGYPVPHVGVAPPAELVAAVRATQPLFWPATYLPAAPAAGTWLAAIWAAVALHLAVRQLAAWRGARHSLRLATRVSAEFAADCALETRVSPAVAVPTVIGALRPVLLLPAGSETRLDAAQRAAVFAYANEFARRRYYAQAQLQRFVALVFWFHPLVRRLGRELPREAELACDEAVIASGFDARVYAEGIVAATRVHDPPDPQWVVRGASLPERAAPRPLGFLRAVAVSACAWVVLAQPLLSGAMHDRLHRQEVLRIDTQTLRTARLELTVAAPGMGERFSVLARADGVLIRNVNLKELLAIAYGVSRFDIIGSQMVTTTSGISEDHWLYRPRWDVRVSARLREPAIFEPYALHESVTRLLVAQFGFEINVNGKCQEPCGRWQAVAP